MIRNGRSASRPFKRAFWRLDETESLERLNKPLTGEGNAVVGADRERQASLTEQSFEGRTGEVFAGRLQGFAQEQET